MPAVAQPISCPKCKAVLGAECFNPPTWQHCPSCAVELRVEVFPALFREETITPAERVLDASEAGCFYHPDKKAAVVCDACGRFLCALCDMDFDGRHICPACLERGGEKGKIDKLQRGRARHDQIALALALLPLLIFYFTLFTAPAALFYAIWHWRSPGSIVPNHRRLILSMAILVASLEIAGWLALLVWLILRR